MIDKLKSYFRENSISYCSVEDGKDNSLTLLFPWTDYIRETYCVDKTLKEFAKENSLLFFDESEEIIHSAITGHRYVQRKIKFVKKLDPEDYMDQSGAQ